MTDTITAEQIVANALPIVGKTVATLKADPALADAVVTGVTELRLWANRDVAVMNLVVANDQPLTLAQLVRAIQCGYIVSAETSTRRGMRQGQVPIHVANGCRISAANMPHEVQFAPISNIYVSDMMYFDGYEAAVNDNGRLDVMLLVGS